MIASFPDRYRHRLVLGAYPIVEVKRDLTFFHVTLDVGNKLFLRTQAPLTSDLRIGDRLTLYTEVLMKDPNKSELN